MPSNDKKPNRSPDGRPPGRSPGDHSGLPREMLRVVNTMQACLHHVWGEPVILSLLSKHTLALSVEIEAYARQIGTDGGELGRKLHALDAAQFFQEIALRALRRETALAQRDADHARAALDRAVAWEDVQDALRPAARSR
jgi:hypothetical protein